MADGSVTRADLVNKIRENLAEIVDDDKLTISEATTADEVQDWDSINHVKLLLALESDLGIRFETDEIAGLKNVGELVDLLKRKL